jgi:hypothetical protein
MIDKKEKKDLKNGLQHLSEASGFFFGMKSDVGRACAFMADNLLKYGQAYLHDADPFDEEENYLPKYKEKR